MRCLADFILDSDLCLPVGAAPLILNDPGGRFSLTLSNASEAEHAVPEAVLSAQVIFETELGFPDERREIDELAHRWLGEALNVLTFTTNRKFVLRTLKPGTCAFMPRDVPHAWKSTGGEAARVLFLYTPGRAGKTFEELLQHPPGSLSQQERVQMRERHGTEIVGPPPF